MHDRIILHIDCNNFYASVEQHHRPELRDVAMVVGGDEEQRHGIVLAKSQLAKAAGIRTGETLREARDKVPGLISVPPNFPLYKRYADLTRAIYMEYTDQIEPFGLDEAWLDVSGQDGQMVADEIRQRVKDELGVTVSVGVSYNKIWAKLGSDMRKPDATTVITRDNYKSLVWPLPVGDLLYVGAATARKLNDMNIITIGQLALFEEKWLRSRLGVVGLMLASNARGEDIAPVRRPTDNPDPPMSVGHSNTMYRDLVNDEDVKLGIQVLSDAVASRLRDNGMRCNVVEISVRDNKLISFTRQRKLNMATCLSGEITNAAMDLFKLHHRWPTPVRSMGVRGSDLTPMSGPMQLDMWGATERRCQCEDLELTIDKLRRRFGHHILLRASLLTDQPLGQLDPKGDNTIHPISFLKGGSKLS